MPRHLEALVSNISLMMSNHDRSSNYQRAKSRPLLRIIRTGRPSTTEQRHTSAPCPRGDLHQSKMTLVGEIGLSWIFWEGIVTDQLSLRAPEGKHA